jgi:hypothetical protein
MAHSAPQVIASERTPLARMLARVIHWNFGHSSREHVAWSRQN